MRRAYDYAMGLPDPSHLVDPNHSCATEPSASSTASSSCSGRAGAPGEGAGPSGGRQTQSETRNGDQLSDPDVDGWVHKPTNPEHEMGSPCGARSLAPEYVDGSAGSRPAYSGSANSDFVPSQAGEGPGYSRFNIRFEQQDSEESASSVHLPSTTHHSSRHRRHREDGRPSSSSHAPRHRRHSSRGNRS